MRRELTVNSIVRDSVELWHAPIYACRLSTVAAQCTCNEANKQKKKWIIHHSELYYFAKFQNVASQNLLNWPNMNDFSLCNDFFF